MSRRRKMAFRKDRREFLKWVASSGLLVSGGVSGSLLSSILGSGPQARAASPADGLAMKGYLFINLFGSPPHWLWQCPLKPNQDDAFNGANPMTGNRLAGFDPLTGRPSFQHSWTSQGTGGKLWPHLWSQTIYTDGDSATVPMSRLLDHWMTIRTAASGIDGHTVNSRYLASAGGNGPSLRGLIADKLERPIHAFHMEAGPSPATSYFKSRSGIKSVPIPPSVANPAQLLLEAFNYRDRHSLRSRPNVWNAVTAALETFRQSEATARPTVGGLFSAQRKAEDLTEQRAIDFASEFAASRSRYERIIQKNLRFRDIVGVSDQVIPGLSLPLNLPASTEGPLSDATITSRMTPGLILGEGVDDMRQLLDNLDAPGLATEFAVAEMALKRELCGAIVMNPAVFVRTMATRVIAQQDLEMVTNPDGSKTVRLSQNGQVFTNVPIEVSLDSHGVGSLITLMFFSAFYRALAAALHELITVLKNVDGKDLFRDLLIHGASEFNRSPDNSQAGSDHDPHGGTHFLLSGRIQGTHIIGDIRKEPIPESVLGKYTGTNGQGAKLSFLGGQEIRPGNILASIAALFEVENPSPNSTPILRIPRSGPQRGNIVSLLPAGRTVDG